VSPITFDFGEGKTRELKFTLSALRFFKENFGKPLWRVRLIGPGEIMPEMAVDHVCMTFVVQAALLVSDSEITFEATEELMQSYISSGGDIQKIGTALRNAFEASGLFGERKGKGKGKDPNEKGATPLN
jgi:hypothetical protein